LTDPEVVRDDVDMDSEEQHAGRERRWWGLLAVIPILLLLMFCVVTSAQVWIVGGPEQARFVARNAECLQCHTDMIPDFNDVSVHNPFALRECTACHTPHGRKVSVSVIKAPAQVWRRYTTALQWLPLKWWYNLSSGEGGQIGVKGKGGTEVKSVSVKGRRSNLVMPETELCWTCHGSMGKLLGDTYRHQPFEAGRCTNCHNPHSSANRRLLVQAPNKLCFTCHPIGMELNRTQSHPPAKQGWCIDCHNPHASNFKGMLVARQRELCFRCHPTVAVLQDMSVQHVPFLNDNCTGCHEPHGSDSLPLLKKPQPTLCYKCHPQIANQFAQPSHHPVGVKLQCSSCHNPHAAQYRGLISARDNEFCYRCHGQIQASYDESKHKKKLCIECHTPHGSAYQPILRDSNPDLCLRCHPPQNFDESSATVYRDNHPVRPKHVDVNSGKALTCTTSCHNPHGTINNYMLRQFDFPKDGNCLMCHAVTPGKRVGIDF
jgi:predicted CXXCH cytochrome family protein